MEKPLTQTERKILELAAVGKTPTDIAAELSMNYGTVKVHLSHGYRKLGISGRSAGTRLIIRKEELLGMKPAPVIGERRRRRATTTLTAAEPTKENTTIVVGPAEVKAGEPVLHVDSARVLVPIEEL